MPTITWTVLAIIVGLVLAGIGAMTKKAGTRKMLLMIGVPLGAVALILMLFASSLPVSLQFLNGPLTGGAGQTINIGGQQITYATGVPATTTGGVGGCAYQETATYTAKDKFSSQIVAGTSYYKTNGQPATTTAITNVARGTEYIYWVSNGTTYVKPLTKVAGCKASENNFIADAWSNGTTNPTIAGYDLVGKVVVTSGKSNISLGANAVANLEITYLGTAKKSAMPFGGLMVVETNTTMASITCTGANLRPGNPSGFHLTYSTLNSTANTYQAFEFDSSLDDGSGTAKAIQCQFKNGGVSLVDSIYFVQFIPANYYLADSGDIVLDVEKYLNQDNTRTGAGARRMYAFWG